MKIPVLLCLLIVAATANAQFGKKLLEQTKESAKRKAEQKVEQKIDDALDLGINKTDSVLTGKKKKKKKGKEDTTTSQTNNERSAGEQVTGQDNNPQQATVPASTTITTAAGSVFTANKLTLSTLFFNEATGSFDPDPNDDLDAAGAAIRQQLKTKKMLVKIYLRSPADQPVKAEEEFAAIKLYLVNKFNLDGERIYFYTPGVRKDGPNRVIGFVAVPETFTGADAAKY